MHYSPHLYSILFLLSFLCCIDHVYQLSIASRRFFRHKTVASFKRAQSIKILNFRSARHGKYHRHKYFRNLLRKKFVRGGRESVGSAAEMSSKPRATSVQGFVMKPTLALGDRALFSPRIASLRINPYILSPHLGIGNLFTTFNPTLLALDINPQILSPLMKLSLVSASFKPKLLYQSVSPSILSPSLKASLVKLEAKPSLLVNAIDPCILGPSLHMHLLRIVWNPAALMSSAGGNWKCPNLNLGLIKIRLNTRNRKKPGKRIGYPR